jgi:hypothetical protein
MPELNSSSDTAAHKWLWTPLAAALCVRAVLVQSNQPPCASCTVARAPQPQQAPNARTVPLNEPPCSSCDATGLRIHSTHNMRAVPLNKLQQYTTPLPPRRPTSHSKYHTRVVPLNELQ